MLSAGRPFGEAAHRRDELPNEDGHSRSPPSPLGELLAEQGKSGWKTVCYLGSVGCDQGVLEASVHVLGGRPKAYLFSSAPAPPTLSNALPGCCGGRDGGPSLVSWLPASSRSAGFGGGGRHRHSSNPTHDPQLALPAGAINKRSEYMALGLAQITNTGPGVADIVEKGGCGR